MVSFTSPRISITDPVAIVHIPINLADLCSTKLYWTVDNAPELSAEFFNFTSNLVEIAVFACSDLVNTYWTDLPAIMDEVKVSSMWRVFEVASGDQGETNNYDSPHLRQVAAPLSKVGISILYQSSYFTDFLLVKESNFDRASQIFAEQGWHVDPTLPTSRRRSQVLTPTIGTSRASVSTTKLPTTPELTVLPSPLACVGFSHSIERATAERVRQLVVWPQQARDSWRQKRQSFESSVSPSSAVNAESNDLGRPFLSYTRTEDGASIVTETRILRWMFGRRHDRSLSRDRYESAVEGTEFQLGGQLSAGYVTDTTDLDVSSEDEGGEMTRQSSWAAGGMMTRGRDSQITLGLHTPPIDGQPTRQSSLPNTPRDSPGMTSLPISWTGGMSRGATITVRNRAPRDDPKVGRKRCLQLDLRGMDDNEDDDLGEFRSSDDRDENYHMEKSGLVTLFSDLLDGGSIRMLYSSTFNTANILVEARDVHRARRLLQGRGRSPAQEYF